MIVVKPPSSLKTVSVLHHHTVFLGGSIEMGSAENWQEQIEKALAHIDCTVLNPRRDDWDSSWAQDPTPDTNFHGQVTWELQAQDLADTIVYYFDPNTKSVVTMLELGAYGERHAATERVLVCCPKEFWRYGNVKIFCDHNQIPIWTEKALFISNLQRRVRGH